MLSKEPKGKSMEAVRTLGNDLSRAFAKLSSIEKYSYRYWRVRILYASIISYAAFYLVRMNFSLAMPALSEEFGYSKTDLGWIITWFSIVYGIGKFINGYISDRSNARYFMTIGLLGSAAVSYFIGMAPGIAAIGYLWIINSWFQSMGWPPAARMLTHWFSPKEIGTKWALWGSSHQIGAITITLAAPLLINHFGWRYAFFVPAIATALLAMFCFNRLRDTPKEVGLPPVEEYKNDVKALNEAPEERITMREVLTLVFGNKLVWYMGLANFCLYIPRMGVFTWAPTFLKEHKGVTLLVAGWQLTSFEVAGLIGGILAGWLSDKVFGGRRGPVGAIYLLFLTVTMGMLWLTPPGYPWVDAFILFLSGFLVYGPQVLAGLAATDFASKRAAGVATGFIGILAGAGGAVVGFPIGALVDAYGWNAGLALFTVSSLAGAVFFALTWHNRAASLETQYPDPATLPKG